MEEHDRVCDYHQDMCPDGCGASILRKDQAYHNCIKKEKIPGKGKSSCRANEALREIRNQKSTCTALVLNKLHFARVIRDLCREIGGEDLRWQAHAIMALQEAAEAFLLCLVEDEGIRAMHMARYAHIALGLGSEV
ncbi:histone H3-like centromeric protein A [Branchiostoma lanceolatum]|uniref:histone H3-like centromeric protein A n=1 Tax=Branchiostoma lanceolatum TaxID=7740 RepID=UPI00345660E6